MAAGSATRDPIEDLCEEATCSICQEYFKDPVTLECGHNFCQACLTQDWAASGTTETSCPQCKEKVLQSNLRPNHSLAKFVEIAKKCSLQRTKRAEGSERICGKHQEPLNLFCKDDEVFICEACNKSKEHIDHRVIPLGPAAQDYKELMSVRQDILEKEKEKNLIYKAETNKEAQVLLKQIEEKMEKTLEESTQVRQFLEEQEKHIQVQMEELKKQITRERDEHLVQLSQNVSSLESLIQEMKEKCQHPPVELLQDVRSILQRSEEKKIFEKPMAFLPNLKWEVWEFCDLNSGLSAVMKQFRAHVTMDPDTANPWLILSEDRRRVTYREKKQNLPDNPERFNQCHFVLGQEGFRGGRHFWEVLVKDGKVWFVGVARKSVQRKGFFPDGPDGGIWEVGKYWGQYRFSSNNGASPPLNLSEEPKRVRVTLNCEGGRVAFYDVDSAALIYEYPPASFSGETLLPFFSVNMEAQLELSL
nr:PREDICTED: E3 ubiquitin-protein ligase TRIM11-like [Anolis carolinensis]|eukprot:XP_016846332.1 PREDICTED: E3 ubiquitin-protein ligase TRIM11-like [Anolis carolinensis]